MGARPCRASAACTPLQWAAAHDVSKAACEQHVRLHSAAQRRGGESRRSADSGSLVAAALCSLQVLTRPLGVSPRSPFAAGWQSRETRAASSFTLDRPSPHGTPTTKARPRK